MKKTNILPQSHVSTHSIPLLGVNEAGNESVANTELKVSVNKTVYASLYYYAIKYPTCSIFLFKRGKSSNSWILALCFSSITAVNI